MKIAVVSGFYSRGMGYTENCLPKFLASLGHEVHVFTSDLNVYGNTADYEATYAAFLGPARQPAGTFAADGYLVHRLPCRLVGGYVLLKSLVSELRRIRPDVVHSTEIASLQTFMLSASQPLGGYELFTETHQHMSVVKPFLRGPGAGLRKAAYWVSRTLPTRLASIPVRKCYAIAPDCAEVAERFYGVPRSKIAMQSLGSDTVLFRPAESAEDREARQRLRARLGIEEGDVLCVYTGRFSRDKNPLLLAQALQSVRAKDPRYKGLFIGDGPQREAIAQLGGTTILPFMTHSDLALHYRASDIAIWPTQESMSMLDAASAGLPLIVADTIGEIDRVNGNGGTYREGDVADLALKLEAFADPAVRHCLGAVGRRKMLDQFSWSLVARSMERDFLEAMSA